jgi:hypothetical protein
LTAGQISIDLWKFTAVTGELISSLQLALLRESMMLDIVDLWYDMLTGDTTLVLFEHDGKGAMCQLIGVNVS